MSDSSWSFIGGLVVGGIVMSFIFGASGTDACNETLKSIEENIYYSKIIDELQSLEGWAYDKNIAFLEESLGNVRSYLENKSYEDGITCEKGGDDSSYDNYPRP